MAKEVDLFDREDMNVLMQALAGASGVDDYKDNNMYEWIQEVPKTTMVVRLVDELNDLGYDIVKRKKRE